MPQIHQNWPQHRCREKYRKDSAPRCNVEAPDRTRSMVLAESVLLRCARATFTRAAQMQAARRDVLQLGGAFDFHNPLTPLSHTAISRQSDTTSRQHKRAKRAQELASQPQHK